MGPNASKGVLPGLNHIAVLVEDVAAVTAVWGVVAGTTFAPLRRQVRKVRYADRDVEEELVYTYSRQPPYVELIQAAGTRLFSTAHGLGPHHVGGFGDPDAERLRHNGLQIRERAAFLEPDGQGVAAILFEIDGIDGVLFEQVTPARQPAWERWIATL